MNELIRCGWSKVKGQGHIGLSSVTFSGSPYFRNAWRESQYHRVFFSGMEQWSMSWTGGLDTGPSWRRRIWTGRWRSQFTNPTLTCGHELWVVTQRTRWWIQVDEMSVRLMVAVLGLEPLLLCVDRIGGSGIWSGSLLDASLWRFSGDPGADPESSEGIIHLIWPGNASG